MLDGIYTTERSRCGAAAALTDAALEGVTEASLWADAAVGAGHVGAERAAAARCPRALVLVHAALVGVAAEARRAHALVAAGNVAAHRARPARLRVLALVQVRALQQEP